MYVSVCGKVCAPVEARGGRFPGAGDKGRWCKLTLWVLGTKGRSSEAGHTLNHPHVYFFKMKFLIPETLKGLPLFPDILVGYCSSPRDPDTLEIRI